jgi:hypothetical protein
MDVLGKPSKNNMSNVRDLFARDYKEKVPPDLRYALSLLQLNGLDELEDRFLSTDAFLRPWSVFRDFMFLLSPDAMTRATQLFPMGTEFGTGISRLEILWFYTQFDEGTLRYDSRADKYSDDYTPDSSVYGIIDKTNWRVEDYEKHLYTWLLQEFKVGKAYSPWRFEYFELRNICTAWEEVLVPIVNAVRASYDPKGRRYYGRMALYVEARCPSRLAFPDSNVDVAVGGVLLPTPYRIVSMPRDARTNGRATTVDDNCEGCHGVLSRKHYDETEKELRDVYPQYGGLVERPKFKHRMDEWLAEQRARANRRKVGEKYGNIQSDQPQTIESNGSRSPSKDPMQGTPKSSRKQHSSHKRSNSAKQGDSPIKRCSDSIKRSLSGLMTKEEHKSPLHGVTRQLNFPDRSSSRTEDDLVRASMVIMPLPRPEQYHEPSEMNVYNSIRNSSPFNEDVQDELNSLRVRANTTESATMFSPMGQLSAIPLPLNRERDNTLEAEPESLRNIKQNGEDREIHEKRSYHDLRIPSYEGTEYQKEISLTDLHTRRMLKDVSSMEQVRSKTPATRLPAPIVPIPYGGPRVASADTPKRVTAPLLNAISSPPKSVAVPSKTAISPPKTIAWPGFSPPKTMAWPGFDSDDDGDFAPPLPSQSPERGIHNPRTRQLMREANEREARHIISREHIRAALGSISRESLVEDSASSRTLAEPVRTTTPMRQQLQTFNTHLFPRKDER